jgi:hypothetical protein
LGASDITLRLDWEVSSLHRGNAVVGVREILAWEVGIVLKDWRNKTLLPCETFWNVGDLESAPHERVSLIDKKEVGLNLIPSELHLLGLEIALTSLGEVSNKTVVVEVNGSTPEGFEGGGPTFDEGLDPEGKRLGYLSDDKVGGHV